MPRSLPARPLPTGLLAEPEPFDDLYLEQEYLEQGYLEQGYLEQGYLEQGSPEECPPSSGPPASRALRVVDPSPVDVARRIRPTTLAVERSLPVVAALEALLPAGLRRGSTVGLSGAGARSLALALVARATQEGSWVAVVGDGDLGLVAGVEAGVRPERLLVVDAPDPGSWASVVATFVGAVDLVLVAPTHRPSAADGRRLAARCRERGSVLLHLRSTAGVPAPARPDLSLSVADATWEGPEAGPAGRVARLRSRRVEVVVEGRGLPPGGRRGEVLLPGSDGAPARP